MLVFVENIGHKYDFQGGGLGGLWQGLGVGGGPDPKKKSLTDYQYIFMDRYQYLKLVYSDKLSSFFT